MHGPCWRTYCLWVFLTMITFAVSQKGTGKDWQKGQGGLPMLPPTHASESDAEANTIPNDVPSTTEYSSNRHGYHPTTPDLRPVPSTNDSESEARVNLSMTPEHQDPLDLHSRMDCNQGSCRRGCEDTRSPFSENPDPDPDPSPDADPVNMPGIGRKDSVTNGCRCDKNCMVFGDCCFDFFSLCLGTNLTSLLSNIYTTKDVADMMSAILGDDAMVSEKASMYLYKTCHVVREKIGKSSSFWMISKCPWKHNKEDSSSQEEYESKCRNTMLDPLGTVPASMIRDPAIVFRNVYCALCNGIEQEKLKLWESVAECPEVKNTSRISYKEFLSKLKECVIYSESLEGARKCSPERDEAVATCPLYDMQGETFRTNSLHCRSYLYPLITDSGQQITNWHCSTCSRRMSFRDTKYRCIPFFHFYGALMPVCQELSCNGLCHKRKTTSNCQCDNECLLFGDCCYNVIPKCLGQEYKLTEVSGNKTLIGRLMYQGNLASDQNLKMLYITHRVCVSVPGLKDQMLWVIGNCPDNSKNPQCTSVGTAINRTLIAPASHKDDPSIIFRNIYCGLCHGISSEDLIQWSTIIYCSEPVQSFVSEEALLLDGTCILKALERKGGRYCSQEDTEIFQNSPGTPDPYLSKILCQVYRYPVYSKPEHVLRNPHCEQKIGVVHSCVSKPKNTTGLDITVKEKGGLSILFNFNENGVSFISGDGVSIFPEISCQIDEVYDHYHDICKKLHCQQGKVAVNGSCIRKGTWFAEERNMVYVNGTKKFIIACYILTKEPMRKEYVHGLIRTVFMDREVSKYRSLLKPDNLTITNVSHVPNFISRNSLKGKDGVKSIKHLEITIKKTGTVLDHLNAFSVFVQSLFDIGGNAENILDVSVQNFVAEDEVTCSFGAVMESSNTSIDTVNGILYANDSDRLYPLDNVAFICSFISNIPHLLKLFVCDIPLNCDPVAYNLTDFASEDGLLKGLQSDLILTNNSYFVSGEQVFSCHHFNRSFHENQSNHFFRFDHVQDILSDVTSGISLISLIMTLTVYILLPELRNLPGRLTMSLSASLMLAQGLLLLIHLPTGVLCQTLAVSLHFLWLCSFMWMTAMSINLARTFTRKMKGSSMTSTAGTHARFSLFVVGFPLVIVTVSAVLDFLDVPGVDIGYGKHGMCWIANPRASIIVFGAPLALMILINLIAFILTFYHIEKSMRASKDISSTKGDRFRAIIYGKLFIIMGLSWGFSFAAAFADFAALWYIFILLNGLQGFCIFISFVCTYRVMRLLKKRILGPDKEELI